MSPYYFRIYLTIYILLSALLSSCSSHFGTIDHDVVTVPHTYTDLAIGMAQTHKILGLGGTQNTALVYQAKRQMMQQHALASHERYNGLTVDFKRTNWIVYQKLSVTVTADIITLVEQEPNKLYDSTFHQKTGIPGEWSQGLFLIGDSILLENGQKGLLMGFANKFTAIIQVDTGKNLIYKHLNTNKLFKFTGMNRQISIGQLIPQPPHLGYEAGDEPRVIGLGVDKLLIQNKYGDIQTFTYPTITQ